MEFNSDSGEMSEFPSSYAPFNGHFVLGRRDLGSPQSCPVEWSQPSFWLEDVFLRGTTTAVDSESAFDGGEDTHSHEMNCQVPFSSSISTINAGKIDTPLVDFSSGGHTHDSWQTLSTTEVSNDPLSVGVLFCQSEYLSLTQNFYGMYQRADTNVPSGWLFDGDFSDRYVRMIGPETYATSPIQIPAGGGGLHSTPVDGKLGPDLEVGVQVMSNPIFPVYASTRGHEHSVTSVEISGSDHSGISPPPGYTFVWAYVENTICEPTANLRVLTTAIPPIGWEEVSVANGRFLMGSTSAGTVSGFNWHNHGVLNFAVTSEGPNSTLKYSSGGTTQSIGSSHDHDVTIIDLGDSDHIPKYKDLFVVKRITEVGVVSIEITQREITCANCEICEDFLSETPTCTQCDVHYGLENGNCVYNSTVPRVNCTDPQQFFDEEYDMCVRCRIMNCTTCFDYATCWECDPTLILHEGFCYSECPPGYFEEPVGQCTACSVADCMECSNAGLTCDICGNEKFLSANACVLSNECPSQTYADISTWECEDCVSEGCNSCSVTNPAYCYDCIGGYYLHEIDNLCYSTCPDGFFEDNSDCSACGYACKDCTSTVNCLECFAGYLLLGTACTNTCPEGYLEEPAGECSECAVSFCTHCSAAGATCDVCERDRFLSSNTCVEPIACPSETYADISTGSCTSCPSEGCSSCSVSNPSDCYDCIGGYHFHEVDNLCYSTCPDGFYENSGDCSPCESGCRDCSSGTICLDCFPTHLLLAQSCVYECPSGYLEEPAGECSECAVSFCTQCSAAGATCDVCERDRFLSSNTCLQASGCPTETYADILTGSCTSCPSEGCSSCSVSNPPNCYDCVEGYHFHEVDNLCYSTCPDGFYENSGDCSPCESGCRDCSSGTICLDCFPTHLLLAQSCVYECPSGYLEEPAGECSTCSVSFCMECSAAGATCDVCERDRFLSANACVQPGDCPSETYPDILAGSCTSCPSEGCSSCSAANPAICYDCIGGYYFHEVDNLCHATCPDGYFEDASDCTPCEFGCLDCSSAAVCLDCFPTHLLLGQNCVYECPSGFLEEPAGECTACAVSFCVECSAAGATCDVCERDRFLSSNTCVEPADCPSETYPDVVSGSCTSCPSEGCSSCSVSNPSDCFDCIGGYHFHEVDNLCYSTCPDGYFDNSGDCSPCESGCRDCSSSTICLDCFPTHLLLAQSCVYECPPGYLEEPAGECSTCDVPFCTLCSAAGATCDVCERSRFLSSNACVQSHECPSETYPDISTGSCTSCPSEGCNSCSVSSPSLCYDCIGGYYFHEVDNLCYSTCPDGYFEDSSDCTPCEFGCLDCSPASTCLDCFPGYFLLGTSCVSACPEGFLEEPAGECSACAVAFCTQCSAAGATCDVCERDRFLSSNTCVEPSACPSETYADISTGSCTSCPSEGCSSCSTANPAVCFDCIGGYHFHEVDNLCYATCPDGFYENSGDCSPCESGCRDCSSANICLDCLPTHLLLAQSCVYECPPGYLEEPTGECSTCDVSFCTQCSNGGVTCDTCEKDRFLSVDNECVEASGCPSQTFADISTGMCQSCLSEGCASCSITDPTMCYSCIGGYYLHDVDDLCYNNCPIGYFESAGNCVGCTEHCDSCTAFVCDVCSDGFHLLGMACVDTCPLGFYDSSGQCFSCSDTNCDVCPGDLCSECQKGSFFDLGGVCVSECPVGTFLDVDTLSCQPCLDNCDECPNSEICFKCSDTFYITPLLNNCSQFCPNGYFKSNSQDGIDSCEQCIPNCQTCSDASQCSECAQGFYRYLDSQYCVLACPEEYYADEVLGECKLTNCSGGCPIENSYCEVEARKCNCSEGYSSLLDEFEVLIECQPICVLGCPDNSECTSPEICECVDMYEEDNETGDCVPVCEIPCALNAECKSPNFCECDEDHYEPSPNAYSYCAPVCSPECVAHSTCSAPDTCICDNGYEKNAGKCEPICTCPDYASCESPGECVCFEGYVEIGGECVPTCTEEECVENAICVEPGVWDCIDGYAMESDICTPVCPSDCPEHAHCSAPSTCSCDEGFGIDEVGVGINGTFTCAPQCVFPPCAPNATCISPGVCECLTNYEENPNAYTHCKPVCDDPVCGGNAVCISPGKCACAEGFSGDPLTECHPACVEHPCGVHAFCHEPEFCECETGYSGNPYEECFFLCSNVKCVQNASCAGVDYCRCDMGFSGDGEDQCFPICNRPKCHQFGECIAPNECGCSEGYEGDGVLECEPICNLPPCAPTNSSCIAPGVCICNEGYTGYPNPYAFCVPVCINNPCAQNAECIHPDVCQCSDGYYGSSPYHPYSCDRFFCGEDGCGAYAECIGSFNCRCMLGYESLNGNPPDGTCEPICEDECVFGNCTAPNECSCLDGYSGDLCDKWHCGEFEMDSKNVCNGKGSCVTPDTCVCDVESRYFGEFCTDYECWGTLHSDESVCSYRRGFCEAPNLCTCNGTNMYLGNECEIDYWDCDGISKDNQTSCFSHGICVDFDKCSCDENYAGDRCDHWNCSNIPKSDDEQVCTGRGICISHDTCVCNEHKHKHRKYEGEFCQFETGVGGKDGGGNPTNSASAGGAVAGIVTSLTLMFFIFLILIVFGVIVSYFVWKSYNKKRKLMKVVPGNNEDEDVTICFTDIQGSTYLWSTFPEIMQDIVDMHDNFMREQIALFKGYEVKTIGDSFMITFHTVESAVDFALNVQNELCTLPYPEEFLENEKTKEVRTTDGSELQYRGLRVRIGLHIGPVTRKYHAGRFDYFGTSVNFCARVEASAPGGRIFMSQDFREELESVELPDDALFQNVGIRSLKGIAQPKRLYCIYQRERLSPVEFSEMAHAESQDFAERRDELLSEGMNLDVDVSELEDVMVSSPTSPEDFPERDGLLTENRRNLNFVEDDEQASPPFVEDSYLADDHGEGEKEYEMKEFVELSKKSRPAIPVKLQATGEEGGGKGKVEENRPETPKTPPPPIHRNEEIQVELRSPGMREDVPGDKLIDNIFNFSIGGTGDDVDDEELAGKLLSKKKKKMTLQPIQSVDMISRFEYKGTSFDVKETSSSSQEDGEKSGLLSVPSSGSFCEPDFEEEGSRCCICLSRKSNVLYFPCKHLCQCSKCPKPKVGVGTCPFCRQIVESIHEVFVT